MPRLILTTTQSLILRVKLADDSGSPIVDVEDDDEHLSVRYRRRADDEWQLVALIAGTASTYDSGGWIGIGDGWHELSLPDEAIVPGQRTEIEIQYAENAPQADAIDAILADNSEIAALVIAGFSASSILLSELGRFAASSEINIRQGDDYLAAKGTAYEKTITLDGYDFTAAGLTVRFGAGTTPGTPLITGSASLHNTAVGSATLRLEFTRDQTKAIAQGSYNWDAELVTSDGKVITVDGGVLNLQASWTTLA